MVGGIKCHPSFTGMTTARFIDLTVDIKLVMFMIYKILPLKYDLARRSILRHQMIEFQKVSQAI